MAFESYDLLEDIAYLAAQSVSIEDHRLLDRILRAAGIAPEMIEMEISLAA